MKEYTNKNIFNFNMLIILNLHNQKNRTKAKNNCILVKFSPNPTKQLLIPIK